MEILDHLVLALGLGALAGVNLYLTVLLTGLAIRFDVLQLATKYSELEILGHPAVLAVAGVLFVVEFFADKVPWVDSAWDSVHTLVRPAGAVFVAMAALGNVDPAMEVCGALLALSAALTTHGAKAGTRLIVNASPEPFSNSAVSIAEDVVVVGGVYLVAANPTVALFVTVAVLLVLWALMPRLFRAVRVNAVLAAGKVRSWFGKDGEVVGALSAEISVRDAEVLGASAEGREWAVGCVTGRAKGFGKLLPNVSGKLVATTSGLVFVSRRWFKTSVVPLEVGGCHVIRETRFLSEDIGVFSGDSKRRLTLRLRRGEAAKGDLLADGIRRVAGQPERVVVPVAAAAMKRVTGRVLPAGVTP